MAEEKIEIDPLLESVLRYCIDNARERLQKGEAVVPFTALAIGDELVMQEHPADDASESFALARKRVAKASEARAYALCYDGFIEVEGLDGLLQRDCILAEGGMPGAEYGHMIGLRYRVDGEGNVEFNKEPIYVTEALNYMAMAGAAEDFDVEVFTGAAEPEGDD